MRKKELLLTDEEAQAILETGEYGVLSTVSPDNEPYGLPLNYCIIGNSIYFHCAFEGKKIDHISSNSNVSFCVVGKTKIRPEKFTSSYESCIVTGTAVTVTGDEKQAALEALIQKYSPQFRIEGVEYIKRFQEETNVVKIIPESFTGKAGK